MGYTKGPWKYRQNEHTDIISLSSWLVPPEPDEPGIPTTIIDLLGAMGGDDTKADAQLIEAAPDLVEICERLVIKLECLYHDGSIIKCDVCMVVRLARATIERAGGKRLQPPPLIGHGCPDTDRQR